MAVDSCPIVAERFRSVLTGRAGISVVGIGRPMQRYGNSAALVVSDQITRPVTPVKSGARGFLIRTSPVAEIATDPSGDLHKCRLWARRIEVSTPTHDISTESAPRGKPR